MLDTIREYALEKASESERAGIRRRMARYYVEYCTHAVKELREGDPLPWLASLDQEQANIRVALGWAITEQPEDALRIAAAMGTYWHTRRQFAEATEWLDQTLALADPKLDAKAAALGSRARIRWRHGEYEGAKLDAKESAELCRRLDLAVELSDALTILGLVCSAEGDDASADRYMQEALQVGRRISDRVVVSRSLNNLGLFASLRGDHARGRNLLEEALAEIRPAGNRVVTSNILDSLGRINLLLGDQIAARSYYEEALELCIRFGDSLNLAECLEGIALLALAAADGERTLRLVAAATVIRKATGAHAMPSWASQVELGTSAARAKVGQRADGAWQQGAAMSVREAARYASGSAPSPARVDGGPLTGREMQVAALIAEGMTNLEIAKRLRMAGRTADAHAEHIRNKLGLRSRSQIAVWAHKRLGSA